MPVDTSRTQPLHRKLGRFPKPVAASRCMGEATLHHRPLDVLRQPSRPSGPVEAPESASTDRGCWLVLP